MAVSLATGATAVIPPVSPITIVGGTAGTTRVTLYTVPTGRTLYVTGGLFSSSLGPATLYIETGPVGTPTAVLYAFVPDNTTIEANGTGSAPLFAASSGQVVTIYLGTGGAGTDGTASLRGFLL